MQTLTGRERRVYTATIVRKKNLKHKLHILFSEIPLGNAISFRTFLCVGPTPMQLSSGNFLQFLSFSANIHFSFLNCTEHPGPFIPPFPTTLQHHPGIQLQSAKPRINSTSSESNNSIQR